jgi:uncharacterized membrane protein YeaQ/YmgE (transglycosylase-associated protein family)
MTRSPRPYLVVGISQLLGGVAIGLMWLAWAPRTVSYLIPGAHNSVVTIPDESERQVSGDGRFLVLCVVAGLLAGVLAWALVRRARGQLMLITVFLGALGSSLLASWLGSVLSGGSNSGALNTAIHPPLSLHATAMLCAQPMLAVLAYTLLAGLSSDPEFTAPVEAAVAPEPPANQLNSVAD